MSYLTEDQKAQIRAAIIEQRDEILNKTKSLRDEDFERETRGDEADIATAEGIAATMERLHSRDARLLRKLEEALRWMDEPDFGYCEVTGEEIGFERLLARPTTRLSIEAKEEQEMRERGFYHPRRRRTRKERKDD